jgi:hypothetical protein
VLNIIFFFYYDHLQSTSRVIGLYVSSTLLALSGPQSTLSPGWRNPWPAASVSENPDSRLWNGIPMGKAPGITSQGRAGGPYVDSFCIHTLQHFQRSLPAYLRLDLPFKLPGSCM